MTNCSEKSVGSALASLRSLRMELERRKAEKKLRSLVEPLGAKLIMPCDVQSDEQLDAVFAAARETFGTIDFLVHSLAYAPMQDLQGPVYAVSPTVTSRGPVRRPSPSIRVMPRALRRPDRPLKRRLTTASL